MVVARRGRRAREEGAQTDRRLFATHVSVARGIKPRFAVAGVAVSGVLLFDRLDTAARLRAATLLLARATVKTLEPLIVSENTR